MRIYFYFPLARQTNLCHEIARYWQETRGWRDFAGVIVVSEGPTYQFMQKQTEVPYHYLDPIRDVQKAALDYQVTPARLRMWEKRLDCPLWHLAVADRQIGRVFVKGGLVLRTAFASKATHENIARLICYYLDFYQRRLESFRPDAVFFPVLAATHALALAKVCQWMEIPFFTLRHTRVLDRYIIMYNDPTERFLAVEKRFHELSALQNPPSPSEDAQRYFDSFRENHPTLPGYTVTLSEAQRKLRKKNPIRFWGGIGYRLLKAAYRQMHYREYARRDLSFNLPFDEWWLETRRLIGVRYSSIPWAEPSRIGEEPYIYYPLHLNPEASTMILAPNFVNQLTVVEALAKNIPLTHKLYVKEHPSMIGRRPHGFYETIKKYPNVRLISSAENSLNLTRYADLVTVITGTAGWEAILMGKPVLTFGESYYTALGASQKCSDLDLLGDQIHRLIFDKTDQVEESRILLFLTALFECSFPLSTKVLWYKQLQPGQIDDEALKVAHKIADQLAATIESFYAQDASPPGPASWPQKRATPT